MCMTLIITLFCYNTDSIMDPKIRVIMRFQCIYMKLLNFSIAACQSGRFGKYCLQECSCSGSECDPRSGNACAPLEKWGRSVKKVIVKKFIHFLGKKFPVDFSSIKHRYMRTQPRPTEWKSGPLGICPPAPSRRAWPSPCWCKHVICHVPLSMKLSSVATTHSL